jgi:hypothetical protein
VDTKCDSSDDKIVLEYRATATSHMFKGAYISSVKDHDASAVAVENEHKTKIAVFWVVAP